MAGPEKFDITEFDCIFTTVLKSINKEKTHKQASAR